MFRVLLVLFPLLPLSACVTPALTADIAADRPTYNERIRQTEDQQLLGNIVRLRYNDTPFFLDLGSVVVQYGVSTSGNAGVNLGIDDFLDGSADDGAATLGGGVTINENPTVSYTPLQGESYARRMLTAVPVEVIWLLSNSGWSIERLMRLTVESTQRIPNAPTASGPQPGTAPQFAGFRQLAATLRQLQLQGALDVAVDNTGAQGPVLRLVPDRDLAPDAVVSLLRQLDLPAETEAFTMGLVNTGSAGNPDISLRTRSLLGVLYYLANGIEVPDEHIDAGLLRVAENADGSRFDWSSVNEGFMRISSSREEPAFAAVKVRYRDHWFYIDDRDPDAKATFSLLQLLFSLQSSTGSGATPLLTLPAR